MGVVDIPKKIMKFYLKVFKGFRAVLALGKIPSAVLPPTLSECTKEVGWQRARNLGSSKSSF